MTQPSALIARPCSLRSLSISQTPTTPWPPRTVAVIWASWPGLSVAGADTVAEAFWSISFTSAKSFCRSAALMSLYGPLPSSIAL